MAVDVTVKTLTLRGDTVGITYVLYTRPESRDSLAGFAVDAPAGVTKIPTPQPKTEWWASPKHQGTDVAYWARLGGLPPGTLSPSLYYESAGLPGIVTYWAVGRVPIPEGEGDDTTSRDPLRDLGNAGRTVGVEKLPSNLQPGALLTRLHSLTTASCGNSLRWITDSELCRRLLANINQAMADHSSGRTPEAKQALARYRGLLPPPGQEGNADRVTSAGYWLLRSNAEIVEARI